MVNSSNGYERRFTLTYFSDLGKWNNTFPSPPTTSLNSDTSDADPVSYGRGTSLRTAPGTCGTG
ncbi:Uncharacterised protein [Mycobacteroides abscessus subsp. abscessus]|nr:Uncharacterised protein [Mycobacteroides abscessus subsp. abscessus]SLH59768.1 Uncharacterised protein [Mycobacteroides abscessus subsp. abscessus]SLH80485.1 Uncharacterised protein [Mycobacteroides abscessus subsp. abscessus]